MTGEEQRVLFHDPVNPLVVPWFFPLPGQHPDQEKMDPAILVTGRFTD